MVLPDSTYAVVKDLTRLTFRSLVRLGRDENFKFDPSKPYQFLKSIYIRGPWYKNVSEGIPHKAGKMKERPRGLVLRHPQPA
jgi:hypothetical protein